MENLIEAIASNGSVFYAVLNPEDNTVSEVSESLLKRTGITDYQNKPLRNAVGCQFAQNCANSAVNIDISKTQKVLHFVDCQTMKQQFFVLKFKSNYKGALKHILIFTDTDSFSPNTILTNNLDKIISHEINNVLCNLQLINQNLLDDLDKNELETFQNLVELSSQNIQVVEKILFLYQDIRATILKDSHTSAQTCDIIEIINDIICDNSLLINQKALKILLSPAAKNGNNRQYEVKYNKGLLYLLFSNLITNATKYSPDSSKIIIKLKRFSNHLETTIENQGEIDKDILDDFFSKYSKGENSVGSGFGTYCCKLITDLFKGNISMKNANNKVTLKVTLPL